MKSSVIDKYFWVIIFMIIFISFTLCYVGSNYKELLYLKYIGLGFCGGLIVSLMLGLALSIKELIEEYETHKNNVR